MNFFRFLYIHPSKDRSSYAGAQKIADTLTLFSFGKCSSFYSVTSSNSIHIFSIISLFLVISSKPKLVIFYNLSLGNFMLAIFSRALGLTNILQLEDLPDTSLHSFKGYLKLILLRLTSNFKLFPICLSPLDERIVRKFIANSFVYVAWPPFPLEIDAIHKGQKSRESSSIFRSNTLNIKLQIVVGMSFVNISEYYFLFDLISLLKHSMIHCSIVITSPPGFKFPSFFNRLDLNSLSSHRIFIDFQSLLRPDYIQLISHSDLFINIRDPEYSLNTFPSKLSIPLSLSCPVISNTCLFASAVMGPKLEIPFFNLPSMMVSYIISNACNLPGIGKNQMLSYLHNSNANTVSSRFLIACRTHFASS